MMPKTLRMKISKKLDQLTEINFRIIEHNNNTPNDNVRGWILDNRQQNLLREIRELKRQNLELLKGERNERKSNE